ncbi:RidA family protein [Xinfangfangia pollutisoli]|uniref:RidA family protein n=1 Tax=Xinfangfangia pollutisoli TaxID=2865960 RepID=UPI001CD688F5|nr:RidA family protein [Xinfangfangia pollutisoli]
MTIRHFNCSDVAAAFGNYSHGVVIPPGATTIQLAGQVGVRPDGSIPEDAGEQTRIIFDNFRALLASQGFGFDDIVKMTYFVVAPEDLPAIRAVRDSVIAAPYPAASLVLVKALGRPEWKLEIDCLAARIEAA